MTENIENNSWDAIVNFLHTVWMIGPKDAIMRETRLLEDLDINGEDADEFFIKFIDTFQLDDSRFTITRYFGSRDNTFAKIFALLKGKRFETQPKVPFTVGDLENAIIAGKLDDELIMKSK
jgi:hypothetical protein